MLAFFVGFVLMRYLLINEIFLFCYCRLEECELHGFLVHDFWFLWILSLSLSLSLLITRVKLLWWCKRCEEKVVRVQQSAASPEFSPLGPELTYRKSCEPWGVWRVPRYVLHGIFCAVHSVLLCKTWLKASVTEPRFFFLRLRLYFCPSNLI